MLSPTQLAALAGGHGDPATLDVLRGGQLGRRRLLTVAAARAAADQTLARRSLDLLTRAERADPAAVAAVLAHPPVTGWARAALDGNADAGYLAALAAAAATRAGLPFELTVPCPDGTLLLPTIGGTAGLIPGTATVRGTAGTLSIQADVGGDWLPARRITLPATGPELLVDDLDPWRHRYHRPPAARLDDAAAARLDRLTGQAWEWVAHHLPAHVDGLGALLRSLVPLDPPSSGNPVSATSRDALGAIALSVPADPRTLALLLVHELQHTKLGALLDLLPLHAAAGPARYRAPWRLDPRPAGALLQGAYAHLGVAEVWRSRRHESVAAAFEYAYWREQTVRATAQLTGGAELTEAGHAFVAGMAATLRRWRDPADSPVDGRIEAAVEDVADGGAVRWALANLTPDPDEVDRLAGAWRRGRPRPAGGPAATVTAAPARPALATETGPEAAVRRRLLGAPAEPSDPDPSDRAYAAGDPATALAGYRRRLTAEPDDADAWVGLVLAARRTGQPAARALTGRPDLARALCGALPGADPLALATWLSG
ncbi:HEXXH motif-containing putative peptide modification protein [Micromonospora sp. WMMD812]|uniref:aKG-HExxH-type peptide beta-hydroxylase n=1 Tax=Micromonospora sp. WMMD812 TaxID=3015152 RepID=UPI00248C4048|nr:HEXXH motif-containing putative peptide modification protein [Micromonospora sp. WMMD812]WBB68131.1 HEXXH motif-containing putative peptide modification protein [Micromonospora sp. WMMD812]